MNTLRWQETAHIPPPVGLVVLGWWDEFSISTVVRRSESKWTSPGYWGGEARAKPLFWAALPDPPMPPSPIRSCPFP